MSFSSLYIVIILCCEYFVPWYCNVVHVAHTSHRMVFNIYFTLVDVGGFWICSHVQKLLYFVCTKIHILQFYDVKLYLYTHTHTPTTQNLMHVCLYDPNCSCFVDGIAYWVKPNKIYFSNIRGMVAPIFKMQCKIFNMIMLQNIVCVCVGR